MLGRVAWQRAVRGPDGGEWSSSGKGGGGRGGGERLGGRGRGVMGRCWGGGRGERFDTLLGAKG